MRLKILLHITIF